MNAPALRWCLWLLLLALGGVLGRAEVAPSDETKLRAAITKGLDFLAKDGETWMSERTCNSCHHLPKLLWAQREAQRRGFPIDQKKFDEYVEWADARAKKIDAGLEMLAFMKLAMPDKPTPDLTRQIVGAQQPDGSWKLAGQFASMQRRAAPEASGNSARLFLLALATQDSDKVATEAARSKAVALLAKDEPAKSVETLIFRMLYARRFGPPEDVASLRAELMKLQHADGGWGWMVGEAQSDSLATGEALYILQQAPDTSSVEAVARAQSWLLSQQREDGSWPIDVTRISKIDRSAPDKSKSLKEATLIYTYWGSAWATIGLLEGQPLTEPPAAQQ